MLLNALNASPCHDINTHPTLSSQPNPPKQQYNHSEKPHPSLPPYTRLLCHSQHAIHSPLDLIPRVFKLVVHFVGQGGGIADFVADEIRQLRSEALATISTHREGVN
jgi:hypothetical protein